MKTIVTFLILAFCISAFPVTACGQNTKQRGVKVRTAQPTTPLAAQPYENLWAVVIGVNKYKHWERLDYAVNDAKSIKRLLIERYGFRPDHVLELLDEDATLVNIRTTLGGVLPQKTKKDDGVLIFFAGHGETIDLPGGGNLGYLVPVDGSTEKSEYFATLLPMTQIREICSMIPAKHLFFVVDACYSGLAATATRGMSHETKQYVNRLSSLRSRQILTAGGRGEPVIEKAEWGHSAFTYKLLEGLESGQADSDNDGVITSGEIATYIKTRVPKISGNRQTPQFANLSDDEGEFLFIPATMFSNTQEILTRSATTEGPDEEAMKKELERLKAENEKLKQQQKQQPSQTDKTKKEEKKGDVPFTPPP